MTQKTTFDIEQYIPYRLVQVQLKMQASVQPEKIDSVTPLAELSQTEFRVLILLASKGSMSPSQIADCYGYDRAVVTRALSALVKKGLLTNEYQEGNRRSKVAQLTALGRQYADLEFAMLSDYGANLDSVLSAEEKEALFGMFDRLLGAVERYK